MITEAANQALRAAAVAALESLEALKLWDPDMDEGCVGRGAWCVCEGS